MGKRTHNVQQAISPLRSTKNNSRLWSLCIAVLLLLTLPMIAMASGERYVLDFNDSHIRGYKGEAATIYLKKSLKAQYPWLRISDLELQKVVLVAKSKRGHGGAELRVGKWTTGRYEVSGEPWLFQDERNYTYDKIRFRNPSRNSNGPWQIHLRGNFKVRKVVVVVNQNRHRDYYGHWDNRRKW